MNDDFVNIYIYRGEENHTQILTENVKLVQREMEKIFIFRYYITVHQFSLELRE